MVADCYYSTYKNSDDDRPQGHLHPSEGLLGDSGSCVRRQVLDLLCADRSPTAFPANILRIFENGHNRHVGLQAAFTDMAAKRHLGIVGFEAEVRFTHPVLPLSGSADGVVTMEDGHRYIIDFKTAATATCEKLTKPIDKAVLQVMTYMGLSGITAAYVIYENKNNQRWLTPMENFRVDFDSGVYRSIEQYCAQVTLQLGRKHLPVYDTRRCDLEGCSYVDTCHKARDEQEDLVSAVDRRPPTIRAQHEAALATLGHANTSGNPAPRKPPVIRRSVV
jgi:hypothetical protein